MAVVISSDAVKETLPGYDPKHADRFHEESRIIADKHLSETKMVKLVTNALVKKVLKGK